LDTEALKVKYKIREILETTGNIDLAIKELQRYVDEQKKKWLLLQDIETGQHILVKYKNRFTETYITETRQKLKFLQKLPENYLLHWTLTIPNTNIHSFFDDYRLLKTSFYKWMKQFQKIYMQNYHIRIRYIVTYETTINEGQLHQHLHCIILGIRYVPYEIFKQMKDLWQRLTLSKYDHLKIPHEKKDVFRYVMKYITKEISCVNYTSIGIFIFDDSYNPLYLFDRYNIDPANRTYILSYFDPPQVHLWKELYEKAMKEYEKIVEVEKKSEEMRSRVEYVKITKPTEDKIDIEKIYNQMPIPHRPSHI